MGQLVYEVKQRVKHSLTHKSPRRQINAFKELCNSNAIPSKLAIFAHMKRVKYYLGDITDILFGNATVIQFILYPFPILTNI